MAETSKEDEPFLNAVNPQDLEHMVEPALNVNQIENMHPDSVDVLKAQLESAFELEQEKSQPIGRIRKSSVDRVVGKVSEAKKESLIKRQEKRFKNYVRLNFYSMIEEFFQHEIEKSSEEIDIISLANYATNEVLKKYQLDEFDIPPRNIHLMVPGILDELKGLFSKKSTEFTGHQYPLGEFIKIDKPRSYGSKTPKLHLAEMIHAKSHNAMQITNSEVNKSDEDLGSLYRSGLRVISRDGKNHYFTNLNEAVTETLTQTFLEGIIDDSDNNPIFSQEIKKFEQQKQEFNFSYPEQREILRVLIGKIYVGHEDFEVPGDVFDIFAKATMTGNILPLGRLIDGVFGKGTFRRIGELDKNIKELKDFVSSL